jgi:hypothetical protein
MELSVKDAKVRAQGVLDAMTLFAKEKRVNLKWAAMGDSTASASSGQTAADPKLSFPYLRLTNWTQVGKSGLHLAGVYY